jgi:hypothetical protein
MNSQQNDRSVFKPNLSHRFFHLDGDVGLKQHIQRRSMGIKGKLLTMPGWTAGQKDSQAVCCQFNWPISCLNWE